MRPITGYAMCSALGSTREATLAALAEGRTGLAAPREAFAFPTTVGAVNGELPDLPRELERYTTRMSRMAMLLVGQLEGPLAKMRARWRPDRIAVVLGTSTAGAERTEVAYRAYLAGEGLPDAYHFWCQHTYGAILPVLKALTGARGPGWVHSTACTSSAKPFGTARRLIDAGLIDAAIVGGIDTLCAMTVRGFHSLGALSATPCRPFSPGRDGTSIGEGGALLIVERDGEGPALLEGVGESSDAYHISAPHPEGAGAAAAIREALAQAGVGPESVDHVNAHGTGTRLNDTAESRAIAGVFGSGVPVVSTKGYTGHTLGAAGAVEAVMAILAIEAGFVPGGLGLEALDPGIGLNLPRARTTGNFRRVLSNSFAFGGNNVSVLLRAPA